jgi:CHAT domain-containing protein
VTLYASLRQAEDDGAATERSERADRVERVVGFGDPSYPRPLATGSPSSNATARSGRDSSLTGSPAPRGVLASGLELTPLSSSRTELEVLKRVYPGHAETWTGRDASEARVMSAAPGASVLHLACHGFVDERFPMESGLALAIDPGHGDAGDNGLLQAWEIFERLRLDADLVTLSACDTGLGQEDAGEGLLGLTWAFLYAGADSVLASLWSVSDASTAALMARFYRELSAGVPEAEALRRAQLALLDDPRDRAPFYWAPFHLVGAGG